MYQQEAMPSLATLAGYQVRAVNRLIAMLTLALGGLVATSLASAQAQADSPTVRPGERLSTWLLRQPADAYRLALRWTVPSQRIPQARMKHRLLAWLAVMPPSAVHDDSARLRLTEWVKSLPVTGRVPITISDPYWLQAHPDQDPVLDADHLAVLPPRPISVTVITEAAQRCAIPHRAGATTMVYLRRCELDRAERIDQAWLIQPDGRIRRFGVARWNASTQDEPAPGALIWAPSLDAEWPEAFSALLAEFLATQSIDTLEGSQSRLPALFPAITPADLQDLHSDPLGGPEPSANDWGIIGLLQTPTARLAPASDLRFAASRVYPYSRGSVITQPFNWMEAGFRYSFVSTQRYWDNKPDIPYADKSLDVKVRLASETRYTPAIALGFTDITGTGLFSSEYFVASKRWGNVDASVGMAWGYLGHRGNVHNPFSRLLGKEWDARQVDVGQGGNFNVSSYFHGPAALFGGVQYQTPWEKLQLKLEYDGNNYQQEPFDAKLKQSSPINAGIVYRVTPSVDVTAGVERGNTAMLNVVFHGLLDKIAMPKIIDPPTVRVTVARPTHEPDWSLTASDLRAQTLWNVREISRQGSELRVAFRESFSTYRIGRIDRAIAVLHRDAPADVDRFVLSFEENSLPLSEHVVLRNAWVAQRTRYAAWTDTPASEADVEPRPSRRGNLLWRNDGDTFSTGLAPSFGHIIGSASGYFLYHLGVYTPTEWRIRDDTWLSGGLNFRLSDNYERAINSVSNLQRVRTYQKEYVKSSQVTLPNLQVTHVGGVSRNHYYSLYGGYLESMFAGVGAEWLYRPWRSPIAVGVDINRVGQRGFKQDFSMLEPKYQVTTGHATLYLDSGWKSVQVKLSAGQYLAGDRGFTVDVRRTFDNGISVGGYLTKTNLSEVQFGEGSYDKGLYVSIPYDALLPFSSSTIGSIKWSGLVRDGGQKLFRSQPLYDLTDARSQRPGYLSAEKSPWHLRHDTALNSAPERTFFEDFAASAIGAGRQIEREQWGSALVTGGILIVGASLLDKPIDRWAKRHQGGAWNTLGKAANAIPFALGAGSALLWAGAGDEIASETAWTSLKAAAITVGTETLAKYAIGRARPDENLGPGHFSAFGVKAANSSFPSIHLGASYALVTPFAEKYDAPWLYALAGATAFGRIQQRQHFASDTAAGGLIGYAVGSLLLDQQRGRRVSLSPDGVQVRWEM